MKRISQRDIARQLGVNVSTVSRALRGLDGVSAELKTQIEQLAEAGGYRPNPFAMSLRFGTTRTIGIVVPDVSFNQYAHIVKSVEAEARKSGYMSIITNSNDRYDNEADCLELLVNMHVEGIIICLSQETTTFAHLERLCRMKMPVVLFDRAVDIGISSVIINDAASAREATNCLIESGARRIAFLGGSNQLQQTVDRKHGYLEALREHGIKICTELVKCHPISFNSGLSDTMELLRLPEPPDAILAMDDTLTIAALQAAKSLGRRIPEDLSIIGYTSEQLSAVSSPSLTFLRRNAKEIGHEAFRLLIEWMEGNEEVRNVKVNVRLEVKESTI